MLLALYLALVAQGSQNDAFVGKVNELAQKRDVPGLQALLPESQVLGRKHLEVLRTGGAYGTGRMGWSALRLSDPLGGEYVVLSTSLTSQDIGELVFRAKDGKLVQYLDERTAGGYQIFSHNLKVRFDLPAKIAHLEDEIELQVSDRPALPCLLRLSPIYKVSRVESGGKPLAFVQAGGTVLLPSLRTMQGTSRLKLTYSGKVDQPGYAGGILANEASLTNDYWYPMIGRLPSRHSVSVTGPKDWVAIGQGVKQSETVTGEVKTTRFRMDLPVVYFSLSLGKYKVLERTIDGKTFRVWAAKLTPEQMGHQIEFMEPVHRYFSSTFNMDPFQGFGALISEPYGGGALEAYSHATYGEGWLPDEDPHEPAHTWWGGQVNNTYLDSFWNESFAVFSEGLYARNAPIGNVEERAKAFVSRPQVGPGASRYPLSDSGAFIGGAGSELGYGKGGFVLQMLESVVGTDGMVRAMRRWLNRQPHTVPGNWEDFERHFLAENGPKHKPFFDAWIRRPGSLKVSLAGLSYADGKLTGRVVQEGTPYPGVAELLVLDAKGARNFHRIDLMSPTFSVPAASKPSAVSLDPWLRLFRSIGPSEEPASLATLGSRWRVYRHPKRADWMPSLRQGKADSLPADWANTVVVAHPTDLPRMGELCRRAGFQVQGETLTYKGTTVDLRRGGALALVDLGGGKRCVIGLGKTLYRPNTGHARLAVFDHLGRFLRGETDPKTSGPLVYPVP